MELIITDIQILCIILCAALSLISYRTRLPPISVIPAIGFFVIGFQIYDASEDLLVLALFYMTAIVQFVVCFGHGSEGRRRVR